MMSHTEFNMKLACAVHHTSFEKIVERIEEGLAVYKQTGNPAKLGAATFLFHVKVDAQNKSMTVEQLFAALEGYSAHFSATKNPEQNETAY